MKKLKIIFLVVLVLGVSTAAGVFAAIEYANVKAIVQERQDQKDAETRAKIEAKEAKEQADKDKALKRQEAADRRNGTAEDPDQVIRGLTADMLQTKMADGSTRYYYAMPTEDGIFIQPSLTWSGSGATLYVTVTHNGQRIMNFEGVEIQTSKTNLYKVMAEGAVRVTEQNGGIQESFTQIADPTAERALRLVGRNLSGKLMMANMPNGSNDDRMIQGNEAQYIRNMMDLYDIFNGKKKTEDIGVNK